MAGEKVIFWAISPIPSAFGAYKIMAEIMAEQASSPVGRGLALSSQISEVSAVKHCAKAES
jgi:hypothetical protein